MAPADEESKQKMEEMSQQLSQLQKHSNDLQEQVVSSFVLNLIYHSSIFHVTINCNAQNSAFHMQNVDRKFVVFSYLDLYKHILI